MFPFAKMREWRHRWGQLLDTVLCVHASGLEFISTDSSVSFQQCQSSFTLLLQDFVLCYTCLNFPCVSMALYFSKVAQSITLVPFLYVRTKAGSRQRAEIEAWGLGWRESLIANVYWVQREAIKLLKSWRLPLIVTPGCKMRTEGGEVLGGKEVEQSIAFPTNKQGSSALFLFACLGDFSYLLWILR